MQLWYRQDVENLSTERGGSETFDVWEKESTNREVK